MKNLLNLLSKNAREQLDGINNNQLLDNNFINSCKALTKRDKEKLTIVMETIINYKTEKFLETKLESTKIVGNFLMAKLAHEEQENLLVIPLNTKNQPLAIETVFKGGLNSSVAHPREIFKILTKYPCARFFIAHNHPSGDPTPSSADLKLTERMIECGDMMGIELLDHIIVGKGSYYSVRENDGLFY